MTTMSILFFLKGISVWCRISPHNACLRGYGQRMSLLRQLDFDRRLQPDG